MMKCFAQYLEIQWVNVNIESLFLGDSLWYTDGKVLVHDEGTKLISTDIKLLSTILGDLYVITIEIDVRTELYSLDLSFDGSNHGKLDSFLL